MSKIINFSLSYHSIGPSALVIGGVTEKCPVRNHNKIGDISEILQGRKITMTEYCYLDKAYYNLEKLRFKVH